MNRYVLILWPKLFTVVGSTIKEQLHTSDHAVGWSPRPAKLLLYGWGVTHNKINQNWKSRIWHCVRGFVGFTRTKFKKQQGKHRIWRPILILLRQMSFFIYLFIYFFRTCTNVCGRPFLYGTVRSITILVICWGICCLKVNSPTTTKVIYLFIYLFIYPWNRRQSNVTPCWVAKSGYISCWLWDSSHN